MTVRPASKAVLVTALFAATSAFAQQPASPFGPNVIVLDPHHPQAEMQADIDRIYASQEHSEFGSGRYAILLMPGQYHLDIPVGFYTQVLGLGATPDAVRVTGNVHSDASLPHNNATCTFWREAEGFAVAPTDGAMQWAVSQAVALRRMHVQGDLVLHQKHGWASGGWLADSVVDGTVDSGTQQQWISRNVDWGGWTGSNWNMVFVGVNKPPAGEWPKPPFTKIATVPLIREKPFLVFEKGHYSLIIPNLAHNTSGPTWRGGDTPGRHEPLSSFYIAHPETDTAATLNAALAHRKNLLFTPGIYDLTAPLQVKRKNTAIFGLGLATLRPTNGTAAMHVEDVDGVTVSGLLFDAGVKRSPSLLEVGKSDSHISHAANPISLHDVFFRVGGTGEAHTAANLVIHSDNTLVDHTWIWRADHGKGVGWTTNTSDNGLIVDGNNVTIYGVFVEHHQQYQVLWQGEHGRVYFYQSEIPYDPPTQSVWKSSPNTDGWASYKVTDNVHDHEAWGLGIYSVFLKSDVKLTRAIEVPDRSTVRFHHMITTALVKLGEITHVINDTGDTAVPEPHRNTPRVDEYPAP